MDDLNLLRGVVAIVSKNKSENMKNNNKKKREPPHITKAPLSLYAWPLTKYILHPTVGGYLSLPGPDSSGIFLTAQFVRQATTTTPNKRETVKKLKDKRERREKEETRETKDLSKYSACFIFFSLFFFFLF